MYWCSRNRRKLGSECASKTLSKLTMFFQRFCVWPHDGGHKPQDLRFGRTVDGADRQRRKPLLRGHGMRATRRVPESVPTHVFAVERRRRTSTRPWKGRDTFPGRGYGHGSGASAFLCCPWSSAIVALAFHLHHVVWVFDRGTFLGAWLTPHPSP